MFRLVDLRRAHHARKPCVQKRHIGVFLERFYGATAELSGNLSTMAPKVTGNAPEVTRVLVGADENGMGPLLGPLVVTAVTAVVNDAGAKVVGKPGRAFSRTIGDSKGLVAFGASELGEAWARALIQRELGKSFNTPAEVLQQIFLDSIETLSSPCPSHHRAMCWNETGEEFTADESLVQKCIRDLARLEKKGISIRFARSVVACNQRLNEAAARGVSRFDVDLHSMERLILDARERSGADVFATCGKVGGLGYYSEKFGPLSGYLHVILGEARAKSEYRFPGVGEIAFVQDADEKHLLVGLASLVGKWVRDAMMLRIVRHFRARNEELPLASGYHDPVTARFIEATKIIRKKENVSPKCFLRENAAPKTKAATATSSEPLLES